MNDAGEKFLEAVARDIEDDDSKGLLVAEAARTYLASLEPKIETRTDMPASMGDHESVAQCEHKPGNGPIYGRRVCEECGEDLYKPERSAETAKQHIEHALEDIDPARDEFAFHHLNEALALLRADRERVTKVGKELRDEIAWLNEWGSQKGSHGCQGCAAHLSALASELERGDG